MEKLGISTYMSVKDFSYVEKAINDGVKNLFISLHIPEEIGLEFGEKLEKIVTYIKEWKFERVIGDISHIGLEAMNIEINNLNWFKENNIEPRLDYGFSKEEIATASLQTKIWVNASTVTCEVLEHLRENGNLNNVSASHDYYPLNNTGLSYEIMMKRDYLLRSFGINEITSFIMGKKNLRGPMKNGLPTLEKHRNNNWFENYNELINIFRHDIVFIGDPDYMDQEKIRKKIFEVKIKTNYEFNSEVYYLRTSDNLMRFKGTRNMSNSEMGKKVGRIVKIKPTFTKSIKVGDLVMLNSKSKRYEGEIAIVTQPIKDEYYNLYNVIGEVETYSDISELKYNDKIKLIKV